MTARVILIAASTPGVALTLTGLAEATGLTVEAVREVLNSQVYQALMQDQVKLQVVGMISRGLTAMDDIVNGQAKNSDRIAAFRSIVQTYDVVTKAMPRHRDGEDEDTVKAVLKMLDKLNPQRSE